MRQSHVDSFETVKDILIYIACSDKEVSVYDVMIDVTEVNRDGTNRILSGLIKEGYLIKTAAPTCKLHLYKATDKAKSLFEFMHSRHLLC